MATDATIGAAPLPVAAHARRNEDHVRSTTRRRSPLGILRPRPAHVGRATRTEAPRGLPPIFIVFPASDRDSAVCSSPRSRRKSPQHRDLAWRAFRPEVDERAGVRLHSVDGAAAAETPTTLMQQGAVMSGAPSAVNSAGARRGAFVGAELVEGRAPSGSVRNCFPSSGRGRTA